MPPPVVVGLDPIAAPLVVWEGWGMKLFLVLFCALTLLATFGCVFRADHGDGGGRGHSERGGDWHGDDHH